MEPWLVMGLGNPGPEYAATRHNVGVMVVEDLARRWGGKLSSHRYTRCEVFEGRSAGAKVVLARGRSYMNESGGPASALCDFFGVDPDHLIVVHDELDIPFGSLRVKQGGGDNGHNGLKSIRSALGTGDFFRVRMGIGRPPGRQDPADFVLKPFSSVERSEVPGLATRGADAVETLVLHGLERTQQEFNA